MSKRIESPLIERASLELDRLVDELHRAGLKHIEIMGEFIRKTECLYLQVLADFQLKERKND